MNSSIHDRLQGIHAATVVPMTSAFDLDEGALRDHIVWVSHTPGIRGLLVNGHAGENTVLSSAEKRRVIAIAREVAPQDCLICSGVNAESSLQAARDAEDAETAGADILLVFPPNSFALAHDERSAAIHHHFVEHACSLPLLLYGAPLHAGAMAYSPHVLKELAARERIVGIKEGSWEVAAYEETWRYFQSESKDFAVLGSGDEHLLTSYLIGSVGSQVSLAALAPDLLVRFYEAASAQHWDRARSIHDLIYPLARAIYREQPAARATARIKGALFLMGLLASAAVRPPQPELSQVEWDLLDGALSASGLKETGREKDYAGI
ncbi:MAG: dihydrodipicolinate synthase family protein [Pseudomonadota bacterium]